MPQFSLTQLSDVLQLPTPSEDVCFQGISIDTRTIEPGNLFIAIKGEHFDGNDFVSRAREQGAAAALVSRAVETTLPTLIVPDTIEALGRFAAYWREQFDVPVLAVTGSNGKTTVKELIAMILQKACDDQPNHRLTTIGNLNTEIGTPLNLLRLDVQHRYAVLELGMNALNEIAYLTNLVRPTVALITNAGPAHLEFLKTVETVAQAKGEIFQGLQDSGYAILNADDDYFDYWKGLAKPFHILTFGLHKKAEVSAKVLSSSSEGSHFILTSPFGEVEVHFSLLGEHNISNALAASAASLAAGISLEVIKAGLEAIKPYKGRLESKKTKGGMLVIDDTYNANPLSLKAALEVLSSYDKKRVLVSGDMRELGEEERFLHFKAGEQAKSLGVDSLFAVGELSKEMVRGFGKERAFHFETKEECVHALLPFLDQDSVVLVKGSRSLGLEYIVEKLLEEK